MNDDLWGCLMRGSLFLLVLAFSITCEQVQAEKRFEQQVIKLQNPAEYHYFKKDGVNFPVLETAHFSASCLVYGGTQNYYVEVGILNRSPEDLTISFDSIAFNKPGYTMLRTDTAASASEVAARARGSFTPTPPPKVQGTTTTTINGGATTFANQTNISGVATTVTYQSPPHAGANLGNAIVNAVSERSFYRNQGRELSFAAFLNSHAQTKESSRLHPGEARVLVATFRQVNQKKAPFEVLIRIGSETLTFQYKE